jgi:hypothetical protein
MLALTGLPLFGTAAAPDRPKVVKPVERLADGAAQERHFKSRGYRLKGGASKAQSERERSEGRAFPSFSSSFTAAGTAYPFTMVGYPPQSGRSSEIRSVIIPLRMNFQYFGANQDVSASFDPAQAVANIVASPMFVPTVFPNGYGQFGDQMQRAAFWSRMDPHHQWHVRMAEPVIAQTVDIAVTPETGSLYAGSSGALFGDVLIDFLDSQAQTILQFLNLPPDTVPIFVSNMVTAEALGYHTAYPVSDGRGGQRLQTYMYTSWLDPTKVSPLIADVSTFNHELMEWMNDPYVNNIVPTWAYPPASDPRATCSFNPFLEVGDPQGNGPTYNDFPTVLITLNGVTYHLQQLVLWQWFSGESPSSAYGGWYSFPYPAGLTAPAVFCP